jgi:nucleotide-binding universal stress UspA family protein
MNTALPKPVVAGVDGSSASVHAVRWAAVEAQHRDTSLRLVFADPFSLVYIPDLPTVPLPQSYAAAVQRQAEHWLQQAADEAGNAAPGLEIDTERHPGKPAEVLIQQSGHAQLIVVGSRGLGGFTGLLVGSTAVSLSAHSHCPVAVVHGASTAPPDAPVVVGVDDTTTSDVALTTAFEFAQRHRAPLRAVHAWYSVQADDMWSAEEYWGSAQTDEERWLAEQLAGWNEKFPDVTVQRFVSRGRPAPALLEHARNAKLVVVGARGRGGFTGLLLGSTSQQLLHHSPCPVVVAR